jgi:hypothetical protein
MHPTPVGAPGFGVPLGHIVPQGTHVHVFLYWSREFEVEVLVTRNSLWPYTNE